MSVVEQLPLESLDRMDLLPLGFFRVPVAFFAQSQDIDFTSEHDDLDRLEIAALRIRVGRSERPVTFALRSYHGAPRDTVDVLLPAELARDPVKTERILRNLAEIWHVRMDDVGVPGEASAGRV